MTTSLLNIGTRSLSAAQGSLSTIAHNIANVNTPGYSRQEAVLSTAGGMFTGAGFFGSGVDLTTVRRQYDQFLTALVQSSAAQASADQARADALKGLDSVFAGGDLGVGAAVDGLFAAASDLANRPADTTARQAFVARAAQLADRLTSVGRQLQDLGGLAESHIADDVTQVNSSLSELRALNTQIAQAQATGHSPNDLLDQRDAALQTLSSLLAVSLTQDADGGVNVFTRSGAALLVGGQQAQLQAVPDPADASRLALQLRTGPLSQPLEPAGLSGGSLAGLMQFRDSDLAGAVNQLGRIAQVVADRFNIQQSLGIDAAGVAGQALFSVAAPVARPHSANTGAAQVTAAVVDSAALRASDYQLDYDGSAWQVTRLADGTATSFGALPAALDGLSFGAAGAAAAGDRFLVRPFAAATTDLKARPLVPRQIATAYAATVQAGAANTGAAVVAGFQVTRAHADNSLSVDITFNNPPTTFNVTGLAGGNLANVPYTPGLPAPAPPADYNGWQLVLDGSAAAGDRFQVRANTAPAGDNRNALAMGALSGRGVVDGGSLVEAYASLLGEVGTRVQTAGQAAEVSASLKAEAGQRQQQVSGVNLDEEAANLLRFQQAYQASARIIQASQTLFEALLSAAGR